MCGQAPGLDADDQRRVDQPAALHALGVLGRDEIVGDHGDAQPGVVSSGSSRSISRVLPDPDRSADADPDRSARRHFRTYRRPERDAVDRLAGAQLAVDRRRGRSPGRPSIDGSASLWSMSRLVSARVSRVGDQPLAQDQRPATPASIAARS